MIPLIDVAPHQIADRAAELGATEYGQLVSIAGYANAGIRFAVDSGAFSESRTFDGKRFLRILKRDEEHRERCLFVAVPDVVGSARRTAEAFDWWYPYLDGWPLALVAQDGIADLDIPWRHIDAVFIGGTDQFKDGDEAEHVIQCAKVIGKWVHVGRINTVRRWKRFAELGADSCDGTAFCHPERRDNREKIRRYLAGEDDGETMFPEAAAKETK